MCGVGAVCAAYCWAGVTSVPVVCPVCDHAFEATRLDTSDTRGGMDRDLFQRALIAQPVYYLIATCPRCYYSDYVDDFHGSAKVDAGLKKSILVERSLRPVTAITPKMRQEEIPATTRYALAAAVFRLRRGSAESQGWLLLRWAWVVREEGSYLPPTGKLMRAMREIEPRLPAARRGMNQADRELQGVNLLMADWQEGSFDAELEPYVRLVIALILRRHGENGAAHDLLVALKGEFESPLNGAIEKMSASMEEERRILSAAREQFERALAQKEVKAENRAAGLYLLGEISRRVGDDAAARSWFDRALAEKTLDASLAAWAREQRAMTEPVTEDAAR